MLETPACATSYAYSVDASARTAYVTGAGFFDLFEALSAPLKLFAHEDFEPGFGVVFALREIEYEPSASHLVAIASNLVRFKALFEHRVAVVVSGRIHTIAAELTLAMAGARGFPAQLFNSIEEVHAWAAVRP